MANDKTQVWKFTKSQILLLTEQARQHAKELEPFQLYQSRAQNDILEQFREELGVPKDLPLTVDLGNLQFVQREDIPAPTGPVEILDDEPEEAPDSEPIDGTLIFNDDNPIPIDE